MYSLRLEEVAIIITMSLRRHSESLICNLGIKFFKVTSAHCELVAVPAILHSKKKKASN